MDVMLCVLHIEMSCNSAIWETKQSFSIRSFTRSNEYEFSFFFVRNNFLPFPYSQLCINWQQAMHFKRAMLRFLSITSSFENTFRTIFVSVSRVRHIHSVHSVDSSPPLHQISSKKCDRYNWKWSQNVFQEFTYCSYIEILVENSKPAKLWPDSKMEIWMKHCDMREHRLIIRQQIYAELQFFSTSKLNEREREREKRRRLAMRMFYFSDYCTIFAEWMKICIVKCSMNRNPADSFFFISSSIDKI